MKITVTIFCVDGETVLEEVFLDKHKAFTFLEDNDHEGSSVVITIVEDRPDKVYGFLKRQRTL